MKSKILLIAMMSLGLTACGTHPDIQKWAKDSTKDMKGKVEKMPDAKPYVPSEFAPSDSLISPFHPIKLEPDYKKGAAGGPDFEARDKRNSPLERYPLEVFTMVGSFQMKGEWMGVVAFDGKTQQIKKGQYLGTDFGLVQSISADEIKLVEQIEDLSQGWVERTNSLYLQKSKEESKK